jgi:hypothetical protein
MKKIIIIIAVVAVCIAALIVGGVLYIGIVGPETFVVSGRQMTKDHSRIIRELDLLEDSERIQYFYSDVLTDIRKGMYFVTDRKLVLYNANWEEPKLIAPFAVVTDAQLERNESFFEDSYITIRLDNGEVWMFPVSSERGNDKAFYDYLISRINESVEQGVPADADKPFR